MSHPWHPQRSIYTRESAYRYPRERVSGYAHRPLRPYNRKSLTWERDEQHASPLAALGAIIPPNCAPLPTWEGDSARSEPDRIALPLYVDSSMLSTWRSCRRKHFWSTINGLYPSGRSVHLVAGGAIAAGCEAARKWVFSQPDPALAEHHLCLEAAYPAFSAAWGDYDPPENPRNAKTFGGSWAALANYLEEYPPGRDPVQPLLRADGSPAIEYRFAVPLPITHPETGDPMLFVGRFDMVGTYGGVPVVLDEKTTSAFTMGWADSWDLRGQFMGYLWALREGGIHASHAVVRGIAIQKTQFDTRSAFVMFPDHLLHRWEEQMLKDVQAICDSYSALRAGTDIDQLYPYDFADACGSYGGCAFAPLCIAANPHDFTSNYIHHIWNPLSPQPIEEKPK